MPLTIASQKLLLNVTHSGSTMFYPMRKEKSHLAFGTFAKTHNQIFAKDQISQPTSIPIFASNLIYWRFFDFQYSPEICIFGKILI